MTSRLILRNARIVTPDGTVEGDLTVEDGRIASIGSAPDRGEEIDVKGRLVLPGGVDPHAHIEQMSGMGLMNADTFETATRSALFGGTTSVISFAAQAKGERLSDTVANYAARARRGAMMDHAFHLTLTDTGVPDFEDDLRRAINAGHRSLKVFTTYNIQLGDADILRIMEIARAEGAVVCVHAENDAIITREKERLIAAGRTRPIDHALSRPRIAEIEAVSRMCDFAEHTGARVMIFHVSTKEAAERIRAARNRGAPVKAETCPHYLFMTEDVLRQDDGGKWMCSPPQRQNADRHALWDALGDGVIDLVSSDHAPYRYDETGKLSAGRDAPFHQIANGLPGLEPRMPLLFDALSGDLSLLQSLSAANAADIYGLPGKGRIAEGADADLVIWNPDRPHVYGADDLHDNVGYNPWEGRTVTGWPETVILRGEVVIADGELRAAPGQGRWIDRPRPPHWE